MKTSKRYFFVFCAIFVTVLMTLLWSGFATYRDAHEADPVAGRQEVTAPVVTTRANEYRPPGS